MITFVVRRATWSHADRGRVLAAFLMILVCCHCLHIHPLVVHDRHDHHHMRITWQWQVCLSLRFTGQQRGFVELGGLVSCVCDLYEVIQLPVHVMLLNHGFDSTTKQIKKSNRESQQV